MTRLSDAILKGAYSQGHAPMLDLQYGGQNGYAPNLAEYVSNGAYIRQQMVCLLLEAPAGFQYLPDAKFWVGQLKAIVELHAKSWDGLKSGLEVEWAETNVGGGGEMQQDATNVTRARSTPSLSLVDKYGRPMQNFFREWIQMLIMDPDSKVPGIFSIPGVRPADGLADMSTATMLFYEADPTNSVINKAWLCTNMQPKTNGDEEGKRDLNSAKDNLELTIEWSAITQSTAGVRAFAQSILDRINFTNANPNLRPAFMQNVTADVAASVGKGYAGGVADLGNTSILRR
jgi:hypothetical protein